MPKTRFSIGVNAWLAKLKSSFQGRAFIRFASAKKGNEEKLRGTKPHIGSTSQEWEHSPGIIKNSTIVIIIMTIVTIV